MSATISDYFNKASNMSGSYPAVATVTAARSTGGSTLSCDDLSTWATDTPVHFSTFVVNADGTIDTSTQTDWKGIVNGNTITDMTRLAGAADSGNASGDRVELNPTVGWLDDLITGILVSHKQNGGLKDSVVTESTIATGAVTNTKLGDGSVTSAKIGTGAISTYDKIGDDVIQARNIDFTTIYTTLFTGKSNGTITLSDSAANYDEIIIYYYNVDTAYCRSERVYSPNNKTVGLTCVYRDANITSIQSKRVAISGNQITNSNNTYGEWISNGTRNSNNHVYIYRVVGVKYN